MRELQLIAHACIPPGEMSRGLGNYDCYFAQHIEDLFGSGSKVGKLEQML